MKLLILPADLHYEYEMKFFQFSDLRAISGMILVCFAVFSAYKAWKNKPLIFFSIIWFFTALLPVSNLYSLTPYAYMAERWLYLPSFGFFILLSMILSFIYQNISRMRIPVSGFITAVLFWHCSMTIEQNHYWKDPITFYERTLKFIPDNAKINTNLGQSYFDAGRIEESVATLQKALILDPKFADAYNDLGSVYAQTGQPEKAIPLFQKYIELKPSDPKGYNNLANAYGVTGETEKAVDLYQKALSIAPDFENARHNLAIIRQGNFKPQQVQKSQKETSLSLDEDAVRKVKAMLEINPGDSAAYGQLGMLYFSGGKTEEAIKAFTRAVSISPDSPHLQNNLGAILITAEKYPDAVSHLKIAIQLNPDYAEAHSNISIAYYRTGQNSLAVLHSDKAVKLGYRVDPEFRKMLEQYR
jgi:tetratricopeptide (TPR) repeat protein